MLHKEKERSLVNVSRVMTMLTMCEEREHNRLQPVGEEAGERERERESITGFQPVREELSRRERESITGFQPVGEEAGEREILRQQ